MVIRVEEVSQGSCETCVEVVIGDRVTYIDKCTKQKGWSISRSDTNFGGEEGFTDRITVWVLSHLIKKNKQVMSVEFSKTEDKTVVKSEK